ncbi:DMT family transporter [Deinococcus lacus]|uniref:DMT family transporter n=1 Tax=Deinococcus lacus TaxID=392561 RepID=A0ABW1YHJ4_9DEIO
MNSWLYLLGAIVAEVIGTAALKSTRGFTVLGPSLVVAAGYGTAFYLLSLALKTIPVGVAYAIWSGLGTALIAVLGWLLYKEALSPLGMLGIALILAGVVLLNLSGKAH